MNRERLLRLKRTERSYRLRQAGSRFVSHWVQLASPGVVVLLTALFLSKLLWPPLARSVWLLPPWVAAVGAHLLVGRRSWAVPAWRASALVDRHSGNRGLYMAVSETGAAEWSERLRGPDVRLRLPFPAGALARAGLMLAALAAVLLLPDLSPAPLKAPGPLLPAETAATIIEQMDAADIGDQQYLEEAKQLLQKLKEQNAEGLKAEDWQALDRCSEELKREALESYRELASRQAGLEELARRVRASKGADVEASRRLAQSLGALGERQLDGLCRSCANGLGMSPKELRGLVRECKAGSHAPSASQMKALLALAEAACQGCNKGKGTCKACLLALGFDEEELAACLEGLAGRGGVSRGPGPAPVLHLGSTDASFGEFKAKPFSGSAGELDADLGYAVVPPEGSDERPARAASGGAVRRFSGGAGGITWHSRLLPRHREVVMNYFSPEQQGESASR